MQIWNKGFIVDALPNPTLLFSQKRFQAYDRGMWNNGGVMFGLVILIANECCSLIAGDWSCLVTTDA